MASRRLILVPQYPAKLRYQEWWFTEFPKNYSKYFDEILVLGSNSKLLDEEYSGKYSKDFSPLKLSIEFELEQIREYYDLYLDKDDVLLLNDISFPGFFTNILYFRRPSWTFAICHATSKNRYDFFSSVRFSKWQVEKGYSSIFDGIFVATNYHKRKLGWKNIHVVRFPNPPFVGLVDTKIERNRFLVSVAREYRQKVNKKFERRIEKQLGIKIERPVKLKDWKDYYSFLADSKFLFITSNEETYGYQVIDAIINGCIPIAPNAFSYPELLPSFLLYDTLDDVINILSELSFEEISMKLKNNAFYRETARIMLNEKV